MPFQRVPLCPPFQAAYFDRDDVALNGFASRFHKASDDKRSNAFKLIDYQNTRGARTNFQDVQKPITGDWLSAQNAIEASLKLEKDLHKVKTDNN